MKNPIVVVMKKVSILLITILVSTAILVAQKTQIDRSGRYHYKVLDTPYGDFSGWIILKKKKNSYEGEIINDEGRTFKMKVLKHKGDQLIFRTDLEDTNSLATCKFSGDSIFGHISVKGDDFPYLIKGKKGNK